MADCNTIPYTIAGIIVGALGGSLSTFLLGRRMNKRKDKKDSEKIYKYILTQIPSEYHWISTRNISTNTDLTLQRVDDLCSVHPKIVRSMGVDKDKWGLRGISDS